MPVGGFHFFFSGKITMRLLRPFRARSAVLPALLASLLLNSVAHAEESASDDRWVSDSLSTYVRSGPTDGHRLVGTLKSGQKVKLLGTQGSYSQVRGESGDTVWISSNDLQSVPGQAERLPQLTERVTELEQQLKTIDDSWKNRVQGMQETMDSRKNLVDELQARNQSLDEELTQAQSQLRDTQARLGDENKQVMMRYMVYGGAIAGAGLLAGLIIPALTRGRKKNSGWA